MNLDTALRQGVQVLDREGIAAPQLTAEVLLMHAAGCDRAFLRAHPEQQLTDLQQLHFARYLHERIQGRPTQYITGRQEFWGLEFRVNPSVLIPRPETEHVVEIAECRLKNAACRNPIIVDCGTGSGCIAIALAHDLQTARVFAGEISPDALRTASENAGRLGVADRVHFFQGDLLSCLPDACVDLVASNPPYVADADAATLQREVRDHEPHLALFAGGDGLAVYRRLVPEAARVLRPGAWLVLELGYNVAEQVRAMFAEGWDSLQIEKDLAGIDRVLSARRSPK